MDRVRGVDRVRQGSVGAGERRRQLTPAAATRVPRDLTVPRAERAEQRGERGENVRPEIVVSFYLMIDLFLLYSNQGPRFIVAKKAIASFFLLDFPVDFSILKKVQKHNCGLLPEYPVFSNRYSLKFFFNFGLCSGY